MLYLCFSQGAAAGRWLGGAGDDVTLLSQVENGHPSTGIPRPIPPASPPALPSPALWPCPLAWPVCPRSPAPSGWACWGLHQHSGPLSDAWCTFRARCDCKVQPGIQQGHALPTHTQWHRELCPGQRGDGATLTHPTPTSRVLLHRAKCCWSGGELPCGLRALFLQGRGEHSSPFFPRAGRVLPGAGPKPAAASQEPLTQKWRRVFSRAFLLGDFLCFASPRPHSKAFPRAFSAAGASGMPRTRRYFHTYASPRLGLGLCPVDSGSGHSSAPRMPRKPRPRPSSSEDAPHP